ncbi:MAG: hypothetical protein VB089_06970 [Anaerolineaceae bacterium]|nr:hypothetical protein [Anaerolineaceae bacterium]
MNGYQSADYAFSLSEFGKPVHLDHCDGWVIERPIHGSTYVDVMGCYPLFACQDWAKLPLDLIDKDHNWISLSLVTDPFGEFELPTLHTCFPDTCIPFKNHYIIDLETPLESIGGPRRRKHARKALRKVEIQISDNPAGHIDDWQKVYDFLVNKHDIKGIRAFSRSSFLQQFRIPGAVMLRAIYGNETVAAQVYLVQGDVVHAHLGACTDKGYELLSTYAIDWFSFEYFKGKAKWLNLGGGIGIYSNGDDGLSQYKSGWATHTRMTYFCGRVINPDRYNELVQLRNTADTKYFPAYRYGEFS